MNEAVLKAEQVSTSSAPSKRIYFPELDGLRFLAFFLVFIHHHPLFIHIKNLKFLHDYGWIGVDLFFVLSSFLFTKLLVAEYDKTNSINIKKFYIRRIFRIWPTYFLFVLSSIAIYFFLNSSVETNFGYRVLGLFTFTDNLFSVFYSYNRLPGAGHLWTIAYEEQFYICVPIILLLLIKINERKKIRYMILAFAVFNIIRIFMIASHMPHPAIWVLPITHFESIILGIVIGFGGFDFLLRRISPLVIGLIGVSFYFLICLLPNVYNITYFLVLTYTLTGISTSLILFSVLNSKFLKRVFSQNFMVFLGKRSYGLYLYHLLGIVLIQRIGISGTNLYTSFIYSLLFTVSVSILSYWLIETPFLKLKKKFEVIVSRPI